MKMCKSWVKTTDKSDQYKTNGGYCVRYATTGKTTCPKNTNSKCEIVTKKPKYKTIKGWANTNNGIIVAHNVPSWNKMDRVSGGKTIPCTILIEAKYLKGGK